MKYTIPLIALAGAFSASAQSLYDTSSSAGYSDNSPFTVTGSIHYGYDDNVNPIGSQTAFGEEIDSSFIQANIGATYSETRSNAYLGLNVGVGAIYYFDDVSDVESVTPVFNLGLNLGYDVNSRIRLSSTNYFTYGLEPDYERGIAADRRQGEYWAYSSYNTIGIRWSQRFGTRHSIGFSGADYGNGRDFNRITFRNELRYTLNDRTILKAGHNLSLNDQTSTTGHSYFGGFEHSFSERGGVDVEVGGSSVGDRTGLYVNSNIRYAVTEKLNVIGYLRYNTDDILINNIPVGDGTILTTDLADFETRDTLRAGGRFTYTANRRISLHGGVDIDFTTYNDRSNTFAGSSVAQGDDMEATLYHLNAGLSYHFNDRLSAVFNYNYTTSEADDSAFYDYDRNRYSVGLSYRF